MKEIWLLLLDNYLDEGDLIVFIPDALPQYKDP